MSLLRTATFGLISSLSAVIASNERSKTEVKAVAKVEGAGVRGAFELKQESYTSNTLITGDLSGLYANHNHEVQVTDAQASQVYNPFGRQDGKPWYRERKVGNLGTFKTDSEGKGRFEINDPYVKLSGPYSIVGRNLTVFENGYDYVTGRTKEEMKKVGRGKPLATGTIQSS
jgi:Cu-Zn family superoxide dismutase